MSASIDIVLIDGGNDVSSSFASPGAAPSRTTTTATEDRAWEVKSGPSGAKKKDETAIGSVVNLASAISKALGGSGLLETTLRLKKSFEDVVAAVINLGGKLNAPEKQQKGPADNKAAPSANNRVDASRQAAPEEGDSQESWNKGLAATTSGSWSRGMDNLTASRKAPSGDDAWQKGLATISKNTAVNAEVVGGAGEAAAVTGAPQAAQGLAAVASAAAPLAIAIGAVTVAAAAGALALKALFDTLSNEVKRLENVSADVNIATSMTEVRREMADMRRAEKIGPDLARFENVRSKLEDKTADLWTEVLKVLLKIFEVIEPAVEVVTDGIGVVAAGMEVANADLEIISDVITQQWADMPQNMANKSDAQIKLMKAMVTLLTDQKDEPEDAEDPLMNAFLNQFVGGGQI